MSNREAGISEIGARYGADIRLPFVTRSVRMFAYGSASILLASPTLLAAPFLVAGGLKILYDLLLYRRFAALRPEGGEMPG